MKSMSNFLVQLRRGKRRKKKKREEGLDIDDNPNCRNLLGNRNASYPLSKFLDTVLNSQRFRVSIKTSMGI